MLKDCIRFRCGNLKRYIGIRLVWLIVIWFISIALIIMLSPIFIIRNRTIDKLNLYEGSQGEIPKSSTASDKDTSIEEEENINAKITPRDGEVDKMIYDRGIFTKSKSYEIQKSNGVNDTNGGTQAKITELNNHQTKEHVQLRVIVLAYNRPSPLQCCLQSLNDADYMGHRVHVEIHIDLSPVGSIDKKTYDVATKFTFSTIEKSVHVHPRHVGLYGQWFTAWTPTPDAKEIALILEDDIAVSKHFYKWLYAAHAKYDERTYVSGYSLANVDYLATAAKKEHIRVSSNYTVYMYPILGSWGFSPHRDSWREFLEWYEITSRDKSFQPYVDGIRHTDWYKQAQSLNKSDTMWTMWHIYFTHIHHLYCVFPNILDRYMFAQNRKSPGLHFKNTLDKPPKLEKLVTEWDPNFVNMLDDPIKVDYYGKYSF
ncbi:unnamed protein product [Owenia fusiformis]|uniref:Uncharacterized protein n=1 Tax=Owenia fusiformis TaxID=6347 RepID=A0A8J1U094_OWEFU|nr:unnamed protein product [Owenia fusiformis]